MNILRIQDAYQRKFERQERIQGLSTHAAGHCVHVGLISPGCSPCFIPARKRINHHFGSRCNLDCVYCTSDKSEKDFPPEAIRRIKQNLIRASAKTDFQLEAVSFSGGGEPLLYLEPIEEFMSFHHDLEKYMKKKPWYYLYTNGLLASKETLLRLKEMGFDEIRFHLGASNFSRRVYSNIASAVPCFKAVSVETPAWPPHRAKLFEMLPMIEDLGVKHLNLGEIEINKLNFDKITSFLPEAEVFHAYELHLDDGGLVYDLIEEIIGRKYSYSVLDCNCFVKLMQRGVAKLARPGDVESLFREYRP